jgi:hypothetical protein
MSPRRCPGITPRQPYKPRQSVANSTKPQPAVARWKRKIAAKIDAGASVADVALAHGLS